MATRTILLWYLACLLVDFHGVLGLGTAPSLLEFPPCGRKVMMTSACVSLNSSSTSEITFTRTDVECLSVCNARLSSCSAAFRNQSDGMCYMVNDVRSIRRENCTYDVAGTYIQIIGRTEEEVCGSHECPEKAFCLNECHTELLSDPVCVADHRDVCDLTIQFLNAWYYWNDRAEWGVDTGIIWSATYQKLKPNTGLRIIQHMSMRGHYLVHGCHHWYVTFDGVECYDPGTIEHLDYGITSEDFHQTSNIDGTCWGLSARDILVELVLAPCVGYGNSDASTGYEASTSTLLMEVVPTASSTVDAEKSCPSSVALNYKHYSWNEEHDVTFNASDRNELVKAVLYTKKASDTSLRLKYNALMSVIIPSSTQYYCGRWFFAINGTECDPYADGIIHQGSPGHWDRWRDSRRVRTIEGICDNVAFTGVISVEMWVGNCINITGTDQPTRFISGGFNSPSRIHIEEVRKNKKVDALFGHDQRIYKSMYGSISHWQWYALNSDVDNGVILSVTYHKQFSDTGLRLTASGSHKVQHRAGYGPLGRWLFRIDGNDCTNPGRIEGITYFWHDSNTHQPMQTSGMCHEVPIGNHIITYSADDVDNSDTATGFFASFHVFVEELRVDAVKICTTYNPVRCDN